MKNTYTQFRIDLSTKKKAALLFLSLGLTMSEAIRLFLLECIKQQGLPFEIMRGKK